MEDQMDTVQALREENAKLKAALVDWGTNAKRLAEKELALEKREILVAERESFIRSFATITTRIFEDMAKERHHDNKRRLCLRQLW